ncbi:haloacid dehalogenase type II [uncultured Cohaesibacter sp.]|uniref:haloacid dehalogenase type II n=1 Tax=uncultured Cohaesibacter sp. TaxID=1002546 RepID=UPI002AAA8A59|nr:haloacid dehalogenase type II [uncultured Cohaesibacter sp.]
MAGSDACSIYVFDAYGTLFDVHAAVRRYSDQLGPNAAHLSEIWRSKQLEYSWVRALTGRYVDFWTLTERALDFAYERIPDADQSMRQALLDTYHEADAFEDVRPVLEELKARDAQLAILSNGTHKMLEAAVAKNGLGDLFDHILSADDVKTYKTQSSVYDLAMTAFRCFPEAISFQSSNRWDVAGATAYGFRTVWINRTSDLDEYRDLSPVAQFKDLKGLLTL